MFKKLTIIAAMILLLLPGAAILTNAADDAHLCGSLSESDCQIVLNNVAAMEDVHAVSFSMNMLLDVGAADPATSMTALLEGGGALSIDAETARELNATSDMPSQDEVKTILETVLTEMTAEMWLDATVTGIEESETLSLRLRMKDGVVLLNAGAMATLTDQEMSGLEWFGLDLNGAVEELLAELGLDLSSDEMIADSEEMEAAEAAAISKTRLPDSEVNGVAAAVFETGVNLETIMSLITLEDLSAMSATGQDANEALDMLENMEIRELSMREFIGLGDFYTYRQEIVMDITVDGAAIADADGDTSMRAEIAIELSDFNQPVEVEVPADAMVFPAAMMLQMGN